MTNQFDLLVQGVVSAFQSEEDGRPEAERLAEIALNNRKAIARAIADEKVLPLLEDAKSAVASATAGKVVLRVTEAADPRGVDREADVWILVGIADSSGRVAAQSALGVSPSRVYAGVGTGLENFGAVDVNGDVASVVKNLVKFVLEVGLRAIAKGA